MLRIHWQEEDLAVERLVIASESQKTYRNSLLPLARGVGLVVADESSEPRPGDFWIGCLPLRGWGNSIPTQIGWASAVEAPIAVGLLEASAHSQKSGGEARSSRRVETEKHLESDIRPWVVSELESFAR